MNKLLVASVVLGSLSLVACAGGGDTVPSDGDETVTETGTVQPQRPLVERCEGTVRCTMVGTTPTVPTLRKVGDSCEVGPITLAPGGKVIADVDAGAAGVTFSWSSTVRDLSICAGGQCLRCAALGETPGGKEAGRCTGASTSCTSLGAGSCGSQDGCSFNQHYRVTPTGSGVFESKCEGWSTSCAALDDEHSCSRQRGCTWEP